VKPGFYFSVILYYIMIDRDKLKNILKQEETRFADTHPTSRELFERASKSLLGGVPMSWMRRWAGNYPVFVTEAKGACFSDVDGNTYIDFCLGDTGAMTGHAPQATVEALSRQSNIGITFMLPIEDAIGVGEELQRRFGLPFWQFALTATDANRHALRLARHITKRSLVLVFNYCYHGTVDETLINLIDGRPAPRPSSIGNPVNPALTTRVIEFNDIAALEAALASRDIACVLAEPAMTNIGIVHPAPGFHDALREITRKTGTLLVIDETHTICCGPGGYTKAHGLQPDMLTIGKSLAGGVPAATYGFSNELAERIQTNLNRDSIDISGIGGTLAGNALSIAAMRATLQNVLTQDAFDHTIPLAKKWADGTQGVIDEFDLDWHVTQLGCRAEYWFCKNPPRNGGEAAAAIDGELDRYMHLAALNRGILMTPFHNMALISPHSTEADIDAHTLAFRESVAQII
jgi:glutamate-1-semialdehyde 2,1-aminomutase